MRASDVMTADMLSIAPDASLETAIQQMLTNKASALMVLDKKGKFVGLVTDTDLLRRVELGTEIRSSRLRDFFASPGKLSDEYAHARGRHVDEVMTREVVSVSPETELDHVVDLMLRHGIKRIPVISSGTMLGVVHRETLLALLRDKLRAGQDATAHSDEEIREAVEAELRRHSFLPRVRITVNRGVVALHGEINDERERRAIHVAAENVAGVTAIHDRLVMHELLLASGAY
jgi:CBS domain-containing protein